MIYENRRVGAQRTKTNLKKTFLAPQSMVSMGLFSDTLKSIVNIKFSSSVVNTLAILLLWTMRANSSVSSGPIGVGVNWPLKDAPDFRWRTEMVVMNRLHLSLPADMTVSKYKLLFRIHRRRANVSSLVWIIRVFQVEQTPS